MLAIFTQKSLQQHKQLRCSSNRITTTKTRRSLNPNQTTAFRRRPHLLHSSPSTFFPFPTCLFSFPLLLFASRSNRWKLLYLWPWPWCLFSLAIAQGFVVAKFCRCRKVLLSSSCLSVVVVVVVCGFVFRGSVGGL